MLGSMIFCAEGCEEFPAEHKSQTSKARVEELIPSSRLGAWKISTTAAQEKHTQHATRWASALLCLIGLPR